MLKTTTNNPLKLAIVGKGAIGGLLANKCHNQHINYQILLRQQHELSLQVEDINGQINRLKAQTAKLGHTSDFDVIILPIKAYQISNALQSLKDILQPNQIIVLLHNGMGTIEAVKHLFPKNPFIAGTTSYAAYKTHDNQIKETGLGETHLGWITPAPSNIKKAAECLLSDLLPPTTWHLDISLPLWKKLTINAIINPLTAIHNIKNGQLTAPKYAAQISVICKEISEIMNAIGYTVKSPELIDLVMTVIHKTANNYSSMHQDIQHNRATEIEFINGYVVKAANKLGIPVPLNQRLLNQVLELEAS